MVKGVPSAHVLISFLGDLLAGSNLERRIFGICLMSELIEKVFFILNLNFFIIKKIN